MTARVLACAALALGASTLTPLAQQKAENGDWPSYGRDPGAQRFSPLTQITPQNVATLERAWAFDTGETAMQVTPLVTTTRPIAPVRVLVQAGDPPGSTVALK